MTLRFACPNLGCHGSIIVPDIPNGDVQPVCPRCGWTLSSLPRKTHVHLMEADDWKGLYIDGELVMEGHSFRLRDLIEALCPGVELTDSWHEDPDDPYLSWKTGSCPEELPEEFKL